MSQEDCGGLRISDQLRLRLLAPADAAALHGLIEADRPHLAEWLPWAERQTLADSEEFVRSSRLQALAGEGMQTALEADGEIVGMVGVPEIDWERRRAAIGYWLAREWQGLGVVPHNVVHPGLLEGWGCDPPTDKENPDEASR